ncbi:UNVERIFIED_CONTAM: hypothetical protein IGO34_28315, partial [Salmonella enterica subsp. enterica serovar Weltevreden]
QPREGGVAFSLSFIQTCAGRGGFALALKGSNHGLAAFFDQGQGRTGVGQGDAQRLFGQMEAALGGLGLGIDQSQATRGFDQSEIATKRRRPG